MAAPPFKWEDGRLPEFGWSNNQLNIKKIGNRPAKFFSYMIL